MPKLKEPVWVHPNGIVATGSTTVWVDPWLTSSTTATDGFIRQQTAVCDVCDFPIFNGNEIEWSYDLTFCRHACKARYIESQEVENALLLMPED